jgi:hypothetical protein
MPREGSGVPFHRSLSGRMLLFGVFPTAAILLGIIAWLAASMLRELRAENEHDMQILADRVAAEIERGTIPSSPAPTSATSPAPTARTRAPANAGPNSRRR